MHFSGAGTLIPYTIKEDQQVLGPARGVEIRGAFIAFGAPSINYPDIVGDHKRMMVFFSEFADLDSTGKPAA